VAGAARAAAGRRVFDPTQWEPRRHSFANIARHGAPEQGWAFYRLAIDKGDWVVAHSYGEDRLLPPSDLLVDQRALVLEKVDGDNRSFVEGIIKGTTNGWKSDWVLQVSDWQGRPELIQISAPQMVHIARTQESLARFEDGYAGRNIVVLDPKKPAIDPQDLLSTRGRGMTGFLVNIGKPQRPILTTVAGFAKVLGPDSNGDTWIEASNSFTGDKYLFPLSHLQAYAQP
jgi:hypothetical protein